MLNRIIVLICCFCVFSTRASADSSSQVQAKLALAQQDGKHVVIQIYPKSDGTEKQQTEANRLQTEIFTPDFVDSISDHFVFVSIFADDVSGVFPREEELETWLKTPLGMPFDEEKGEFTFKQARTLLYDPNVPDGRLFWGLGKVYFSGDTDEVTTIRRFLKFSSNYSSPIWKPTMNLELIHFYLRRKLLKLRSQVTGKALEAPSFHDSPFFRGALDFAQKANKSLIFLNTPRDNAAAERFLRGLDSRRVYPALNEDFVLIRLAPGFATSDFDGYVEEHRLILDALGVPSDSVMVVVSSDGKILESVNPAERLSEHGETPVEVIKHTLRKSFASDIPFCDNIMHKFAELNKRQGL